MDLAADSMPFEGGLAHKGMAMGSNNIMDKCLGVVQEASESHPDYGILVTGYSLGAGICQLLTMALMRHESFANTTVRCISYGAPPVFESLGSSLHMSNVFNVVNYNDGLATASLHTVTKFFERIKARLFFFSRQFF